MKGTNYTSSESYNSTGYDQDIEESDPGTKKEKKTVMTTEELIHCVNLIRNGTPEQRSAATEEILIRNEPYIKSLIRTMYPTYANKYMEDMLSCGNIGILCALYKADPPYDPTMSSFTTFVSKYIIHEISDCVSQMVHNTSPHYSATAKKINRAIASLQQKGIAAPTITDIMAETKLGSEAIQTVLIMQSANSALPLDHPNVMDVPANEQESPAEVVERLELLEDLNTALTRLSPEERLVLELQYGLNGKKHRTQAEIAKILGQGVTVHHVHRLRAKAYRKLYHDAKLRSHFEYEYKQQEKQYDRLVEQTLVPLILSASSIEREMLTLAEIPLEEISL